jgi:hypothetical protein
MGGEGGYGVVAPVPGVGVVVPGVGFVAPGPYTTITITTSIAGLTPMAIVTATSGGSAGGFVTARLTVRLT